MKKTILQNLTLALFIKVLASAAISLGSEGAQPIADAGSSRYAAMDPVQLDGTGSYDPDSSGKLSYTWQQIAGPSVGISYADTAKPTISRFAQTDAIQECEFELVVSVGELTSLPDTVKVIIVPDFGASNLRQWDPPFDPNKPTILAFGGGGAPWMWSYGSGDDPTPWCGKANFITFGPYGASYERYGDMAIVYLSSQAPDYKQPIQTVGHSAGGPATINLAIHLNETYADPRYAVNRVTLLDPSGSEARYSVLIEQFLASAVDGEQCWVDGYEIGWVFPNALTVRCLSLTHQTVRTWYMSSLTGSDMNKFNNGVVAGAYWSVVGPGKNLQLASTPGELTYVFQWHGDAYSGYMDFHDESTYPARLPEPVTLLAWRDSLDSKGVVLTCKESENAVGYQLLFGSNSYRVMDYTIISDIPTPPDEIITTLPFEKTWWTVRVRDEYGSTIYADPKPISIVNISLPIENISKGRRYGYIQDSIVDSGLGDTIVVGEGIYQENIDFKGKSIILQSTDPNDPAVVAATVINGVGQRPVVTFSGGEEASCLLAGFTITGGTVGISCGDASPTIRNCTIGSNGPNAIEFWEGYEPRIIDCTVLGYVHDRRLLGHWALDETEGIVAQDSAGRIKAELFGDPVWRPTDGMVDGALTLDGIDDFVGTWASSDLSAGRLSVFAWIKVGAPGQVVVSQSGGVNWLMADASHGYLKTDLKEAGDTARSLVSEVTITDGNWHHVGITWDGMNRFLYVDGVAVASDTQTSLKRSSRGLNFGCGPDEASGTFWSGLIDDVRIYDVALTPEEIEAFV